MGRPRKEINQDQFENLCGLQCTQQEICDWFRVTDKTLSGWCKRTYGESFSETYQKKRGAGKISLRRMQWQLAAKSPAMAIFLGKNILGQTDRFEGAARIDDIKDDELSKSLRDLAERIDNGSS